MKTPLFILLMSLVIISPCYANGTDNVLVVKNMIEAVNNRNLEVLDLYISEDIVRHSGATPGVNVTNLEEFRDFLRSDFAVASDSVQEIDIIFGSNEYVAVRARYIGTQTGEMGPFPASGKKMELPFIGILRFSDGKIVEMWVEWDNLNALSQLGHFPPATE